MTSSTAYTLIAVDPSVEDYQSLIESVGPNTEILVLDATKDGVEQIADALTNYSGITSLQILSHGQTGQLQLGTAQLNADSIDRYSEQFERWSSALASDADILLYGCDVAAGELGSEFVQKLSAIVGADVAASTDLTGNTQKGGDWDLEASTGQIESSVVFRPEAQHAYSSVLQTQVLLNETFSGADVTSGPWLVGVGPGNATQTGPILTARNNPAPSQGGIPGRAGAIDAPGQGTLRLTDADRNETGFVIYNRPISSNAGLSITFDIFSYGGTGADGIGFFLIDGSQSPTVAGGFGGSFGYAPRLSDGIPGLQGGYLGIAFDEFGNFSSTEVEDNGIQKTTGPGRFPDSISVRGSQQTDYAYLTGTGSLPQSIDVPNAANREAARRRVNVELTRSNVLSVRIDFNGDGDYNDPNEVPIDGFDAISANSAVPETFKFGFSGATGTQTNIHEIRNLSIETLSQPPSVDDATVRLNQGQTVPVQGLNATDPDGTIAQYVITSLPTPEQGTLFLGNPNQGGTPITIGQEIAPNLISQVFFRGNPSFFGNTSFTYNAFDDTGSADDTPGNVRLIVQGVSVEEPPDEPGCLPGENLRGTKRRDRIEGTENKDTIRGLQGNDVLLGLECGDTIEGNQGRDRLIGDGGNDLLRGNQNNDVLSGGNGTDFLFGNLDNDSLNGGLGNDRLDGGIGRDRLAGSRGNDRLFGDEGDDTLSGGAGVDRIDGGRGQDVVRGAGNRDVVRGRQDNDRIRGDRGTDRLFGNLGDDLLRGNAGNDRLDGGVGNDKLFGGRGNDRFNGKEGNDVLYGNRGRDRLIGGEGDDLLVGGPGQDVLTGGVGADRFFFLGSDQDRAFATSTGEAPDITDFNFNQGDKFLVSVEGNLGKLLQPTGLFNAGRVAGRNIVKAAGRAYADKDQQSSGRQSLQTGEAVFFGWRGDTYLAFNNGLPGYGFRDLTVETTGIRFKAGDANAGILNVSDYFSATATTSA